MPNSHRGDSPRPSISRRQFVQATSTAGVASLAGLAGCVGGGDSNDQVVDPDEEFEFDEQVTVELYADPAVEDLQDRINAALHEGGLDEQVSIEVNPGPSDTDERRVFITNVLEGGRSTPDLMITDSGWTIPFISRGQALNLEENLPEETLTYIHDEYFDDVVATAADIDDNLHALPLFSDFATILYRQDLVEEAGYDPDGESWATESMSWEEFSHMVEEVRDHHGLEYGYTFQANGYEGLSCCTFNEILTSWGGAYFGDHENLFGPVGDRPITVTEESVLDSIRMVRTFIHGHDDEESLDDFAGEIAPNAVLQWIEDDSLGPFSNGDVVAHRNWAYAIAQEGADDALGDNLGVMPIPYGVTSDEAEYEGTGGPVSALGGAHIMPNPNTEKIEAVLAVIQAFTSEEVKIMMWEEQGWIPPEPGLFDSDKIRETEPVGRYMDALEVAGENAVPRPVTDVWATQSTPIYQEVYNAFSQNKSPGDAMADLKDSLHEQEQAY